MKRLLKQNQNLLLGLFVFFPLTFFGQTERNEVTDNIYRIIRDHSRNFPEPIPLDTILVGTFDHLTGQFAGLKGKDIEIYDGRKYVTTHGAAVFSTDAGNSILLFKSLNSGVRLKVTINNVDYTGGQNQTSLYIPIRSQSRITWKAGIVSTPGNPGKTYQDVLQIVRKKYYGMGSYTLPYIPISIVYAPPVTGNDLNKISYTQTSIVGTTLNLTSSKEISESRPKPTPLNKVYDAIDFAIQRTSGSPDPYTQSANIALKAIRGAFGDMKITVTSGTITQNGIEVTSITQNSVTRSNPIPTAGPVHSDQFIILKNVRVIWMVTANEFSYSILDYEKMLYLTNDDLRASSDPALQSLVTLDVFARNGPQSPRYTKLSFGCGGSIGPNLPMICNVTKTQIVRNTSATTNYTSQITDYTSGTLGFLGLGFEDKTVKQVFSNGFSTTSSATEQTISVIDIINKTSGIADFAVYYDNLFGTIAVLMIPKYKVNGGPVIR